METIMKIRHLVLFAALATAAAGMQAQQTEFRAPDSGFHSALTRAEVRADQRDAFVSGVTPQKMHDGQDMHYAAGKQTRRDVRAEAIQSAQLHRRDGTRGMYFGD
ncbi:DUF4148 domain-containing protein|uniref:DUF4148 domain-containing protein n=1 Tax=Noviherbaspirillum sp. L7-7A TaxID=2850560 RepID=UPI001C2C00DB|nr:DUF4148 domain-containing protein [Noviherbaspirillum sp. L7-7A]MBV0879231.1 DUF4148 domain-containing protein [Noviherbaspirillum sp. L7-7A]